MGKEYSFTKMQGIGNDYIYFDCTRGNNAEILANAANVSIKLSERHFGIGSDGMILLCDSDRADFRMRMFNADGSESMMCGNGIRCLAKFAYDNGLTDKRVIDIDTLSGVKHITLMFDENDRPCGARVDMGAPGFAAAALPVCAGVEQVIEMPLEIAPGRSEICTCVSMGNPHCVIFSDVIEDYDLVTLGNIMSSNKMLFPEGINTEIARVEPDGSITMRVWERGSGETFACGTGSCGVLAAAVVTGRLKSRSATLHLLGGDLFDEWDEATGSIFMTGAAVNSYRGVIEL